MSPPRVRETPPSTPASPHRLRTAPARDPRPPARHPPQARHPPRSGARAPPELLPLLRPAAVLAPPGRPPPVPRALRDVAERERRVAQLEVRVPPQERAVEQVEREVEAEDEDVEEEDRVREVRRRPPHRCQKLTRRGDELGTVEEPPLGRVYGQVERVAVGVVAEQAVHAAQERVESELDARTPLTPGPLTPARGGEVGATRRKWRNRRLHHPPELGFGASPRP